MKTIYLDNAATTPCRPEVVEAMLPYFTEKFGNPSAIYNLGQVAQDAIQQARKDVAGVINAASPNEVFFTSGGSEADNWALKGVMDAYKDKKGKHLITTKIEHHAILHTAQFLEQQGFEVTYLDVDKYGLVSPEAFEAAIRPDTVMASIMFANNEIGTIEPIKELAAIAHAHKVIFHTDAVQAFCHEKIDVQELGIDLMSASGHKLYGPKGVGMLYVRRGVRISNLIHGGGQERGKRATTENTAGIVGFAKAAVLAEAEREEQHERQAAIRNHARQDSAPGQQHQHLLRVHRGRGHAAAPGCQGHLRLFRLCVHQRLARPQPRAAGHRPAAREGARLAARHPWPRHHPRRRRLHVRRPQGRHRGPARDEPPVGRLPGTGQVN